MSIICQGWNSPTRTWGLFTQGLYKYTITVNIGIVAVLHRKMFSGTTPTSLKKKEERNEEGRREDWFPFSPWIMCLRLSCVLETNHVAVYVKVCTYMCTSLNWLKGVSSGLIEDIIQYILNTTHLQVFYWNSCPKDPSVETSS